MIYGLNTGSSYYEWARLFAVGALQVILVAGHKYWKSLKRYANLRLVWLKGRRNTGNRSQMC